MDNSTNSGSGPLQFDIGGMHCAACSSRIERVLSQMPGIEKASVNLASAKAKVWPASNADPSLAAEIMARIAKIGFSATKTQDEDAALQYEKNRARIARERKARLRRLVPMICLTAPLLAISMGHMLGMPLPAWLEPQQSPKAFIAIQLLLTLPVVWLGRHFYTDGLSAIRRSPR